VSGCNLVVNRFESLPKKKPGDFAGLFYEARD